MKRCFQVKFLIGSATMGNTLCFVEINLSSRVYSPLDALNF